MTRVELLGKLLTISTSKELEEMLAASKLEFPDRMFEYGRIFGKILRTHGLTEEAAIELFSRYPRTEAPKP